MKAYLFIPTGEVRPPEKDEHYLDDDGKIEISHGKGCVEFPIIQRHEIDISPETHRIDIVEVRKERFITTQSIMLNKPKVKKWLWVVKQRIYNNPSIGWQRNHIPFLSNYLTEKQVNAAICEHKRWEWAHKIDETMIEEEE